jgi:hypothetical protein
MTIEAPPAPPPAAEPKPNSFARIFGVLFSPNETFASIARRPTWAVPLLVIIVVSFAATAVILPRMDWDKIVAMQQEQIKERNPNVSQQQLDQMERMTKAGGKVFAWAAPVVFVIWYLLVAGVLLLTFRLMGGEGNFSQAFSATLYAWMPQVISSIIGTIVAVARGGMLDPMQMATMVKTNPGFLADMKTQPMLFALLSSLDIFTIWTIVLLIIGFAALARVSKAKAAAIVITWWVVVIGLFKLAPAAFRSMRK